ncbi:MAG: hypothetical protein HN352_10885 [Bacteroidetes bacterium]|jgi:hypothetical protein|nr:hypothetical protein [Bacteroidota bacterium]MBT4401816.1 hypothetical protein [Bacteroidota bacterium]MBT4410254.1 hypothetical protein [Bacteroidota bacterium]MBT5425430.1 hypothetical protein [Bacteroidota bacterium]MBT7092035.1 hypothetical protein [Bacteroidota bacterium]
MGKKLIILACILVMGITIQAQDVPNRIQIDEETYQLYLRQDWRILIDKGNYALELGYDYYYLRMRLAIAWYSLRQYERARTELLKALSFTPNDPTAMYYLYYSNLFSGRYGEARILLGEIPVAERTKMKALREYSVRGVFAEGGVFTNNSVDELQAGMPTGDFVSSYFITKMNYANASIGINLGYKSSLTIAGKLYDGQALQNVYTSGELFDFKHTSRQTGVYLGYQYSLPKSWYFGASLHNISGVYSVTSYQSNPSGQYNFTDANEIYKQSFVGGYLGKHFTNMDVNFHFSQNNFWQGVYYQAGTSLVYYPFGSLDYYVNVTYDRMNPSDSSNTEEAWKLLAGAKLFKGFYIEGSHLFGNLSNWADAGGYYLFNTVHPIRSRTGISLVISGLIPQLQISLSGYLQQRDHYADVYLPDGSIDPVLLNFKSTSIFGGITWNF